VALRHLRRTPSVIRADRIVSHNHVSH
jgi:hypothetical protein